MKKHRRIYQQFFDIAPDEYVPCEHCVSVGNKPIGRATDVHHADRRGMGGDQTGGKDVIENLGGVCKKCHLILDAKPEINEPFKLWLKDTSHRKKVMARMMYSGW